MKIREWISQTRNDFYAHFECEHCEHVTGKQWGYDDKFYHEQVLPKMNCESCGMNRAGESAAKTKGEKSCD